jgi:16S rRNA (guanine1207-N2)-methyltransferase
MTHDAFIYALDNIAVPAGNRLWLYGEPAISSGMVYQPWYDKAHLLQQKHCAVFSNISDIGHGYDAVLINCPKQREETEGLLALALERSKGFVMAIAPNDAGGGRLLRMFGAYGIEAAQLSKSHCRIVWTMSATDASRELIAKNISQLALRKIELESESWWSVPGIFGWDKIDPGSRLLLDHLPASLSGNIADFGCGYGYLARALAQRYPAIKTIDAYDADARAVAACTLNANEKIAPHWQDIRMPVHQRRYDAIVMNPPFHNGKKEDASLGEMFIQKAWASLVPGGQLFLVANRHLPYEKTVAGLTILFEGQGYKIITGKTS